MKSWFRSLLFFIPGVLIFNNSGIAQTFRNFSEIGDVTLSSVLASTQDKQGFMWFGSSTGLLRYDSKTFKVYGSPSVGDALKKIRDLYTDSRGNIWIGTIDSGLILYKPDSDSFTQFKYNSTNKNSISSNSVVSISEDDQGHIWAGTRHGLSRITYKNDTVSITRVLQTGLSTQSLMIKAIASDRNGNMWVATEDGLIKLEMSTGKSHLYRLQANRNTIRTSQFVSVSVDQQGVVWLGSDNGGLYKFDPGSEEFKLIENLKTPDGTYPWVYKMLPDGRGKTWLATSSGIAHFDPNLMRAEWFMHVKGDPNSLVDNTIFSMYRDKQGGLWCGSYYSGLSYLHYDSPRFKPWPFRVEDPHAESFSNAWIGKGKNKQIWTVSDNKDQMIVFDSVGKHPSTFSLKLAPELDYYSFYIDGDDMVWAGGNSTLTSYNPRTNRYQNYPIVLPNQKESLKGRTNIIFEDSYGNFWVGGSYGLLLFDKALGKFKKNERVNFGVNSIFEDAKHNLWLGTTRDIYRLRTNNLSMGSKSFEAITIQENQITGCWRICEDLTGNIWAACHELLLTYNSKRNIFETIPGFTEEGYFDLVVDNKGYIWVNASSRLYRYHPVSKTLQSYSYKDGLPREGALMQGAGIKDGLGNLYFVTNQGMFSFDPAAVATNNELAPVMLTALKLYNKEVTTGDSTGLLKEPLWKTKEITFRHDQSIFTIDFSLLNYVRSDLNKYAYKIDGIDRDWNYVQNPSATYTNLPSGTYTFQVKAANGDGFWVKDPLRIKITILPPWWKTWYAYLFYVLIAGGAIYAINRFFWLRSSFRKENALNQVKLDFFTNVSHEIRTHLALISGPLEKAYQNANADQTIGSYLTYARNNSDRLMLLVNELLDFRKIQNGNIQLRVAEHNVVRVIQTVVASFEHLAKEKNIKTTVVSPDTRVMLWFDLAQMQKVFYNLLSNAYKFTPDGGKITVRIAELSNEVNISVEDNGKGMSQEHLKKLFTYYYQADSDKPGYGIGLALSKSIVEQHQGYLYADSSESSGETPGGTKMTIRLLTKNRHFTQDQLTPRATGHLDSVFSPVPEAHNSFDTPENTNKQTLLIIEDNDELRAFIKELFNAEYHILEAENGLRGLELANEHLPDIVLSDVMMPGMNGVEVCNQLKSAELTSHIPVVLLTARTQNEQVIEGLTSGADDYVFKPFDPRILELKLSNLIRLRGELKKRYQQTLLSDSSTSNSIAHDVNDAFINKLRAIVTQNISKTNFGVNEMASEAGMSVSVLYRKMKSLTDMTVNEFIKNIRLNEARKFLESGVYQVNEVATIVGFDDSKYFSKEFRKVFGKTPTEVRKQAPHKE